MPELLEVSPRHSPPRVLCMELLSGATNYFPSSGVASEQKNVTLYLNLT